MHQASRATIDDAFGATTAMPGLTLGTGTGTDTGDPSITADGLIFVFAADPGGNNDLYAMTRSCQ